MSRHGIETREPVGEHHGLHGEQRDEETKAKISETMQGREFPAPVRKRISEAQAGRELSEQTRDRISEALTGREKTRETRRRMSESSAGTQNPNWKGGYGERYGAGWNVARERALERDGVCLHCGEDGASLQLDVHHIVPVRIFRELSGFEVSDAHRLDNLVVLCKRCHALAEHDSIDVPSPD